jgi:hypothetical protein
VIPARDLGRPVVPVPSLVAAQVADLRAAATRLRAAIEEITAATAGQPRFRELDLREVTALLVGLRLLQGYAGFPGLQAQMRDLTEGVKGWPMTAREIDSLCQWVNGRVLVAYDQVEP